MFPEQDVGYNAFDLNLSFLFMKFSIDDILNVILAILLEQKLVFMCKNYGLLTPIIEVLKSNTVSQQQI